MVLGIYQAHFLIRKMLILLYLPARRDFYLAGPRFLGRLRHEMRSKIKHFFNFDKT